MRKIVAQFRGKDYVPFSPLPPSPRETTPVSGVAGSSRPHTRPATVARPANGHRPKAGEQVATHQQSVLNVAKS